jgi:flagellum-specific ATP synthase
MSDPLLGPYFDRLHAGPGWRWQGRVSQVLGNLVESQGPFCGVGERCDIVSAEGKIFPGEIIGFRGPLVLSMPLEKPIGIRFGDTVSAWGTPPSLAIGPDLLGRIVDGEGHPLDHGGPYRAVASRPLDGCAPAPMVRKPIREPLGCGVRAIDAFISCGRGQRIGIFGGSGVGKSTLIGMMARGTNADLTVAALVGERGREVREFVEDALGMEGLKRSVVVVSTSDQSPLLRIRAALAATTIAEYFCQAGKDVLLVIDSLTRFAMAQREIGLAAGEPPTSKGYTPSVFTLLARLVERAGCFETGSGSITAFYTVLMEGDDQQDPLVDAVRSLVDGHIVLDRRLAAASHYPPIAILDSLSRLASAICSAEHREKVSRLRALMAAYEKSEDLVRLGAYQKGADPVLDRALEIMPPLTRFLQQDPADLAPRAESVERLLALPS